jgi:hypothetical protein
MRKSTPVVSSGEVASYDSVSRQTIVSLVGHLAEFEEAVALVPLFFLETLAQKSGADKAITNDSRRWTGVLILSRERIAC